MSVILIFISAFISALSPPSYFKISQSQIDKHFHTPSSQIHEDLVTACRCYNHDKARSLLSQGADVNYVDKHGFTPLYWAIKNSDKYGLQILLDHDVDINKAINPNDPYLKRRGNKTNSPLFFALTCSTHDDATIVQILLEAGAQPNVDYQEGWTCLTYAIWYTLYDAIDLLLKFGADVNQPSHMGTPLYLACYGSQTAIYMQTLRSVELVRQLLIRGADPNNTVQKNIPFGFNMAKNVHNGLGKEVLFQLPSSSHCLRIQRMGYCLTPYSIWR